MAHNASQKPRKDTTAYASALDLGAAILAFVKKQTPNRELIDDALPIARQANCADRFSGPISQPR